MKKIAWVLPDEKVLAAYYTNLLKQGFIKKPKPLENVAYLYCKICGDTVHSKWSGDYVSCKCGQAAIDQTHEYTRLIGNKDDYEVVK
jgi:hypothetical protein